MEGRVIAGAVINTAEKADNVIVLGMALENGKPSSDLLKRVETAGQYLEEYPDSTLILTGGNPDKNGVTEAAVMRDILLEKGVSEDSLILEDKAATTRENFINAAEIADPAEPVVFVSSDYHMDRAVRMAEAAGFRQSMRLPAPSDPLYFEANVMWEIVSDIFALISR